MLRVSNSSRSSLEGFVIPNKIPHSCFFVLRRTPFCARFLANNPVLWSNGATTMKNLFTVFTAFGLFFSGALLIWAANLQIPDLDTFEERRVPESTKIYDRTGTVLLFDFHKDVRRKVVTL